MSSLHFIGVLFVVLTFGWIEYDAGFKAGKKAGYSICVSEEDDDNVRTRKF